MKKLSAFFLVATLFLVAPASAADYLLTSPNGQLTVEIRADKQLAFSVSLNGQQLLKPSTIGLELPDGTIVGDNLKGKKAKISKTQSQDISAPFYRQKSFKAQWRQLDLPLGNGFSLQFRAFDEGVAYRFCTTQKREVVIKNERANYQFGKDKKAWLAYTTNAEKPFAMAFQNIYDETLLDTAVNRIAFLPATVDCGAAKVTLLESDLRSYPGMFVRANGHFLQGVFAPYPKKMDYYKWRGMSYVAETEDYICKTKGARTYPWRILAVTQKDTEMPVNNLVYALAEPNRIGDTSWIKPGKVAWDWWNDWNLKGVDFETGINNDTYKYYIDFAAKNHVEYVVLDEGWYDSNRGDIMNSIDAIDLPGLISYGRERGVGIVLWTVFNVLDEHLEEACKKYADMGIKGFKVDFIDRDDQTAVEMAYRIAEACARHHLFLDYHGFWKPTGMSRTFPNLLNYEGVFGMEEIRWCEPEKNMPLYQVTFPYIRMMAGQVDFTPGAMRNGTKYDWKAIYTKPISMGTRCNQLACYIIHDSPFTMLCDSPTNYEREEECLHFITSLPVVFDETRIPQGEMGKYIVTARRKGSEWFVAGQTNWDARELTISFDFLDPGKTYQAQLFCDGTNANHDAEDYQVKNLQVNSTTQLNIKLASGGGFALTLKP